MARSRSRKRKERSRSRRRERSRSRRGRSRGRSRTRYGPREQSQQFWERGQGPSGRTYVPKAPLSRPPVLWRPKPQGGVPPSVAGIAAAVASKAVASLGLPPTGAKAKQLTGVVSVAVKAALPKSVAKPRLEQLSKALAAPPTTVQPVLVPLGGLAAAWSDQRGSPASEDALYQAALVEPGALADDPWAGAPPGYPPGFPVPAVDSDDDLPLATLSAFALDTFSSMPYRLRALSQRGEGFRVGVPGGLLAS